MSCCCFQVEAAARELVQKAIDLGSHDNVSAVVVCLNQLQHNREAPEPVKPAQSGSGDKEEEIQGGGLAFEVGSMPPHKAPAGCCIVN